MPGEQSARNRGFFFVFSDDFANSCLLGLDAAAAFLVLCAGTGPGGRRSTWSGWAIQRYTGLGRMRAKQAIRDLITIGLVRLIRGGARPAYEIGPVEIDAGGRGEAIFFPASFVRGIDPAGGALSPLARIRATRDMWLLELAVSLHDVHDLLGEEGIYRKAMSQQYQARRICETRSHVVWAFRAESTRADLALPPASLFGGAEARARFWPSVEILLRIGVLEIVPHLIGLGDEGEISIPLAPASRIGAEADLAAAATAAAKRIMPPHLLKNAADDLLVPGPKKNRRCSTCRNIPARAPAYD